LHVVLRTLEVRNGPNVLRGLDSPAFGVAGNVTDHTVLQILPARLGELPLQDFLFGEFVVAVVVRKNPAFDTNTATAIDVDLVHDVRVDLDCVRNVSVLQGGIDLTAVDLHLI
jgi:hypothetical protein